MKQPGYGKEKGKKRLWRRPKMVYITDAMRSHVTYLGPWPILLEIDKTNPNWRAILAHEWGHCLDGILRPCADLVVSLFATSDEIKRASRMRCEIIAWRLAKSYLNSALWNEKVALEGLAKYWLYLYHRPMPANFRILEYQPKGKVCRDIIGS